VEGFRAIFLGEREGQWVHFFGWGGLLGVFWGIISIFIFGDFICVLYKDFSVMSLAPVSFLGKYPTYQSIKNNSDIASQPIKNNSNIASQPTEIEDLFDSFDSTETDNRKYLIFFIEHQRHYSPNDEKNLINNHGEIDVNIDTPKINTEKFIAKIIKNIDTNIDTNVEEPFVTKLLNYDDYINNPEYDKIDIYPTPENDRKLPTNFINYYDLFYKIIKTDKYTCIHECKLYCDQTRSCKVFYSKKITDVDEIQKKLSKVNAYIDSVIENIKYIENKNAQIRKDIERDKEKERLSKIKNNFFGKTIGEIRYPKKKGGRKLKKAKTSKKAKKSKKATKKRILR